MIWPNPSGDGALVKLLIQAGADHSHRANKGGTALGLAASHGQNEVVKILLDSGVAVDQPSFCEGTPLHMAAAMQQPEVVRTLIARGANVNGQRATTSARRHYSWPSSAAMTIWR